MEKIDIGKWGEDIIPQYITDGNTRYELLYFDSEFKEYQEIELDYNTTIFSVVYDYENISINNNNAKTGLFFVPFIEISEKQDLIKYITKMIKLLGKEISNLENTINPFVRVKIYRHISEDGKRYFAISGTNMNKRDKIIHDLNIQTDLVSTIKTKEHDSWFAAFAELGDINESPTVTIEKDDLLDFESHTQYCSAEKQPLILLPNNADFFAKYTKENYGKLLLDKFGKTYFSYELNTFKICNYDDYKPLLAKAIKCFKEITGNCYVKAIAKIKHEKDYSFSLSIMVVENNQFFIPEDEEGYLF